MRDPRYFEWWQVVIFLGAPVLAVAIAAAVGWLVVRLSGPARCPECDEKMEPEGSAPPAVAKDADRAPDSWTDWRCRGCGRHWRYREWKKEWELLATDPGGNGAGGNGHRG